MKLTLTQPDLNQALRSVSRAVGTGRNSHPVLAHVLLTTGNGNLQVSAYDLDLGITTPVVAVVDTAGAITIPYRLLADIIGRLDSADVVTLAATGTEVTVTTLSGSYKLLGGVAEDFPALPAVEVSEAVCVAFEPAVLVAASTDEAKQMLTGINVALQVAPSPRQQPTVIASQCAPTPLKPAIWHSPSPHAPSAVSKAMCY
jgi:DNA polymerase III subunit beta